MNRLPIFLLAAVLGTAEAQVVVRDSTTVISHPGMPVESQSVYVSESGNDSNPGTQAEPVATGTKGMALTGANGTLHFECGGEWGTESVVSTQSDITITSYGTCTTSGGCNPATDNCPRIGQIDVKGQNNVVENILFDSGYTISRGLRGRDATNITLRNVWVQNYTNNCIDVENLPPGGTLTMEDVTTRICLSTNYPTCDPDCDAHGLSIGNSAGATVTINGFDCELVSGDCIQADPSRASNGLTVTIDDMTCAQPALTGQVGNWQIGDEPGEDCIDTKNGSDVGSGDPITFNITDLVCDGYDDTTANACFNVKEHVIMNCERCQFSNTNWPLRVRKVVVAGRVGDPLVKVWNSEFTSNLHNVRVEDGLTTLILWNNLLDDTVSGHFNVAGVTDFSQFDCKNNVHVEDSPHAACTGNGNLLVDLNDVAGAFVNYGAGNYKLADPSVLVNAGVAIASVTHDIEGDARPIGSVWDVGPYEDDVSEPGGSPPPSTDNEFWDSEIERIAGECTLPCDGTTGDVVLSISYRSDDTWSLPTPPITGQSVLDYIDQTGVDPLNDVSHDAAEDAIRMWKHVNGSESDFLCMRENCLTGASAETLGPFANDDMWIEVDIKVGDWRYFAWSNYSGLKFMRGAYSDAGPGTCDGGSARMFDWNPGAMQSPGDFGNMIRVRPYCGGTWLSGNEVFRHPLNEWVRYRIHWNLTSGAWKVWAKVLTGAEAGDYMLLDSETANGNHAGRAVAIEMSYSSSSGSYDDPGYTSKPDYPYLKTWVKNFYLGQGCIRMGAEDPTCD